MTNIQACLIFVDICYMFEKMKRTDNNNERRVKLQITGRARLFKTIFRQGTVNNQQPTATVNLEQSNAIMPFSGYVFVDARLFRFTATATILYCRRIKRPLLPSVIKITNVSRMTINESPIGYSSIKSTQFRILNGMAVAVPFHQKLYPEWYYSQFII